MIITAESDPLSDDGKLYADALNAAGSKANALMAPGSFHGFMPFRHGKGREEAECAIHQFISGRAVENVQLCRKRELRKNRNNTAI